jgi:hypothetical protein
MRRNRTVPEKLRAALNTLCLSSGYFISPNELQRTDFTHVLCPNAVSMSRHQQERTSPKEKAEYVL